MAVRLLEYFKHDIEKLELIPSDGGCFEVSVDEHPIFSKLAEDRFPTYQEIKKLLTAR
ncbi:MAG: Rdx family protein [candidate division Zixibacteria bacterium]|nr:Rdx family protein [candidate division Zixibacteria bacterium]